MTKKILTTTSPKYGFKVSYYSDDRFIGQHAPKDNIEPFEALMFQRIVTNEDVVVDAGANIGFYTLLAARKGARVFAFEPEKKAFKLLRQNVDQNNYTHLVEVFNGGLGAEHSMVPLYECEINQGDHRTYEPGGDIYSLQGHVPITTVDSMHRDISVIKMDTQGFEWEIWKGMRDTVKRAVDRGRFILFTEFTPDDAFFGPHSVEFFEELKNTFGDVHIIDSRKHITYPIGSVKEVKNCIRSWGHTHANLVGRIGA